MIEAYPLQWPLGWPRTPPGKREDSRHRFKRAPASANPKLWTFAEARDELFDEVRRLGGRAPILSSNFETDRYGIPTDRGRMRPSDQGVAIYFTLSGQPKVMAADMHLRAEENMRSLALALEAMRQLARHGGGTMQSRAFEGFAALPAPDSTPWWQILQVPQAATHAEIEAAYRRLARERHPDMPNGSDAMMADLNRARDAALKERS